MTAIHLSGLSLGELMQALRQSELGRYWCVTTTRDNRNAAFDGELRARHPSRPWPGVPGVRGRSAHPMTTFPLFADDWHRRDYDALIEKRSDARMWLRGEAKVRREQPPTLPAFLQRKRKTA